MMDTVLATPERWESQAKKAREAGYIPDSDVTYEQIRDFHQRGEYKVVLPTTRHIGYEFKVFEPVLHTLVERKWTLCVAASDSGGFITTDNPVCLMHSDGAPRTFMRPVGHGLKGTTVLFPVSRDLLAVGTFEGDGGVRSLPREFVAYFNALLLGNADKHVFAADDRFFFSQGPGKVMRRGVDLAGLVKAWKVKGK